MPNERMPKMTCVYSSPSAQTPDPGQACGPLRVAAAYHWRGFMRLLTAIYAPAYTSGAKKERP